MIVFDLCCAAGDHRFEAWFASSDSFAEQRARDLIACPVCGDVRIEKAVMAPRIGAKSNQLIVPAPTLPTDSAASNEISPELVRKIVAEIAAKQAEMLPQSRWVGRDFADAARAMHEGRAPGVAQEFLAGRLRHLDEIAEHGVVLDARAADLHGQEWPLETYPRMSEWIRHSHSGIDLEWPYRRRWLTGLGTSEWMRAFPFPGPS